MRSIGTSLPPTYLALALALLPSTAEADLILRIGPATLGPGGSGSISVFVRSDGATERLSSYQYQLVLRPAGATFGELRFGDPQPGGFLGDPAYVFVSSFAATIGSPGAVGTTVLPGDTFVGNDFTTAAPGFEEVGPSERLLGRIQLTSSALLPTAIGDRFLAELVADNGSGVPASEFLDDQFAPIAFSGPSGGPVIGSIRIVPEPGTLLLAGLGLSISAIAGRCRFRAPRPSRTTSPAA